MEHPVCLTLQSKNALLDYNLQHYYELQYFNKYFSRTLTTYTTETKINTDSKIDDGILPPEIDKSLMSGYGGKGGSSFGVAATAS